MPVPITDFLVSLSFCGKFTNPIFGQRADHAFHFLTVFQQNHRRNAHNPEFGSQVRGFIGIDLVENDLVGKLRRQFFDNWIQSPASRSPVRRKFQDNRFGRLLHQLAVVLHRDFLQHGKTSFNSLGKQSLHVATPASEPPCTSYCTRFWRKWPACRRIEARGKRCVCRFF